MPELPEAVECAFQPGPMISHVQPINEHHQQRACDSDSDTGGPRVPLLLAAFFQRFGYSLGDYLFKALFFVRHYCFSRSFVSEFLVSCSFDAPIYLHVAPAAEALNVFGSVI
jgi:hypothetical protein